MAASVLADTGAILAFLDRADQWHTSCQEAFQQLRLPLLTSEAVLTELSYLARARGNEMETVWKFVESGSFALATIEHLELPYLHGLMSQYADRPMDFADATLVYLARRESISTIFTVDHADFSTYRIDRSTGFRIVPSQRP